MNKLAEKFNVDLSDLHNLLEGVVAYVEVRTEDEDISLPIAREMKEIGATISENRNSKVTHVIFRNGTLRTSNWAKKHDIPLVDLGWLAACTKIKTNLVSKPWHVRYLVQEVDVFGSKRKPRYKKYFKNMNIEEYEAEHQRNKKKRKKLLEKSFNNSKSDNSFNCGRYDSPEHERIMKRSDPMRVQPVPDIVSRFQARLEKYKQTGRYSWELSSESSSQSEDDDQNNSTNQESLPQRTDMNIELTTKLSNVKEENSVLNTTDNNTAPRKLLKSRRLFKELNQPQEILIEPVHHSNNTKELKSVLPGAVQKKITETNRTPLKRSSWLIETDDCEKSDKKPRCFATPIAVFCSDISLPKRKPHILKCAPSPESTVPKHAQESVLAQEPIMPKPVSPLKSDGLASRSSTSPLIQSISANSSPSSSPIRNDSAFVTPKMKKRTSLRTRLLKRRYRQSQHNSPSDVLVPDTDVADRRRKGRDVAIEGNSITVLETPNQLPDVQVGVLDDSFSSVALGKLLDTPNMSRTMDRMLPNRVPPPDYRHELFVPKDFYNHYFHPPPADQARGMMTNSDSPQTSVFRSNCRVVRKSERKLVGIRRSSRLSEDSAILRSSTDSTNELSVVLEPLIIPPTNSIESLATSQKLPENVTTSSLEVKGTDSSLLIFQPSPELPLTQRRNTRRSVAAQQPIVEPIISTSKPQKRTWSEREQQSLAKPAHKIIVKAKSTTFKKPCNSPRLSDYITTPPVLVMKQSNKPVAASRELILVGFSVEEQQTIKYKFGRLPSLYYFGQLIRSKEQIVVLPDTPKRSVELIKAFVFGNPLVSVTWIYQSFEAKKWLNYHSFVIKDYKLLNMPPDSQSTTAQLFNEYSAMYLSSNSHGIHKHKLRAIIEMAGGKVTDSFRQAGVVINTRKVNALSVTENWVLDSVQNGSILNPKKYSL